MTLCCAALRLRSVMQEAGNSDKKNLQFCVIVRRGGTGEFIVEKRQAECA